MLTPGVLLIYPVISGHLINTGKQLVHELLLTYIIYNIFTVDSKTYKELTIQQKKYFLLLDFSSVILNLL